MLFKNIDELFSEIGFEKYDENEHFVGYKREKMVNGEVIYTQFLDLGFRYNGLHTIQSYAGGVNCEGYNNMIGLSMYEATLAVKKMKHKGWKVNKESKYEV